MWFREFRNIFYFLKQPKNVRVLKKTAREHKLRKTCYSYEEKGPHYNYCLQQGSTVT